MALNSTPIYIRRGRIWQHGAVIGTTANTATDGTGSAMYLLATADATEAEGAFIKTVRLMPISTIAATIARVWVCTDTGSYTPGTTNTAANTTMIGHMTIGAWTASNTLASPTYDIGINEVIGDEHKILISFGTSTGAGTTGFNPTVFGGDM